MQIRYLIRLFFHKNNKFEKQERPIVEVQCSIGQDGHHHQQRQEESRTSAEIVTFTQPVKSPPTHRASSSAGNREARCKVQQHGILKTPYENCVIAPDRPKNKCSSVYGSRRIMDFHQVSTNGFSWRSRTTTTAASSSAAIFH